MSPQPLDSCRRRGRSARFFTEKIKCPPAERSREILRHSSSPSAYNKCGARFLISRRGPSSWLYIRGEKASDVRVCAADQWESEERREEGWGGRALQTKARRMIISRRPGLGIESRAWRVLEGRSSAAALSRTDLFSSPATLPPSVCACLYRGVLVLGSFSLDARRDEGAAAGREWEALYLAANNRTIFRVTTLVLR